MTDFYPIQSSKQTEIDDKQLSKKQENDHRVENYRYCGEAHMQR